MGADLVGYMIVIDRTLSIDEEEVVQKVLETVSFAKKWCEDEDLLNGNTFYPEAWHDLGYDDSEYVEWIADLTEDKVRTIVNEVVDFLKDPVARDVCSRRVGDELVIFAGDTTWGDEPEGCGYAMIKQIFALNIASELGVE